MGVQGVRIYEVPRPAPPKPLPPLMEERSRDWMGGLEELVKGTKEGRK